VLRHSQCCKLPLALAPNHTLLAHKHSLTLAHDAHAHAIDMHTHMHTGRLAHDRRAPSMHTCTQDAMQDTLSSTHTHTQQRLALGRHTHTHPMHTQDASHWVNAYAGRLALGRHVCRMWVNVYAGHGSTHMQDASCWVDAYAGHLALGRRMCAHPRHAPHLLW
jgi:hypothetical protein